MLRGAPCHACLLHGNPKGLRFSSPFHYLPALKICVTIGIATFYIIPDAAPATSMYMAGMMGPIYSGIASMAVLAACISSGTSFLMSITTLVTRDFYKKFKPNTTDRQQLTFGIITSVVLGLAFTQVGLRGGSILGILTDSFVIQSMCAVPIFFGLYWKRFTNTAAFWSALIGASVATAWFFLGHPFGISGIWVSSVITVLTAVIITLATSKAGSTSPSYTAYIELAAEYEREMGPAEREEIQVAQTQS